MTPTEIIYHRRVRVLELAAELGNVTEAYRLDGVSRTRYYEWKHLAEQYGQQALVPKDRRRPYEPNETPTHVVAELMSMVVAEPTIGAVRTPIASRTAAIGSRRRPCRRSSSPTAWAAATSASRGLRRSSPPRPGW